MKQILVVFILSIPSMILTGGAVALVVTSLPGWGWLLFVAFLLSIKSIKVN